MQRELLRLTPNPAYSSAPFDGGRFANLSGHAPPGFRELRRWRRTRSPGPWPASVTPPAAPPPATRVDDGTLRYTVVGHATVLIQVAGLNILIDPMWSDCAGPSEWLGVKRICPPAFPLAALPPIDAVLLSHSHYDHLDRPTLRWLTRRDNPPVLTGLKVGPIVPSRRVTELDWWQGRALGPGVHATYVPAEHGSARGPFDRNRTLWGGFVLETPAGVVYLAGDTAIGGHFALIHQRWGAVALSFLPIGAYEPRWFMAPVHMNPAEAVEASALLGSAVSVAIHFGTFPLADEGYAAPAEALRRATPPGCDFRVPRFGQAVTLPPSPLAPAVPSR